MGIDSKCVLLKQDSKLKRKKVCCEKSSSFHADVVNHIEAKEATTPFSFCTENCVTVKKKYKIIKWINYQLYCLSFKTTDTIRYNF